VVYTWSPAIALLLLWPGWLRGGVCAYAVGRVLGRPVIRMLLTADVLERYEERFTSRMSFGMVVLLLALPSDSGYLLGRPLLHDRLPVALGLAELPTRSDGLHRAGRGGARAADDDRRHGRDARVGRYSLSRLRYLTAA
jgi:hypothetical protein